MMIDSHVHVFPDELAAGREKLKEHEPYFASIFVHPSAPMSDAAALLAMMESEGVEQAVVCAFPWRDAGRARAHNRYILEQARRHPGRLVPLAAVDPLSPGALAEAERALADGAAGLGEVGAYLDDLAEPRVLHSLSAMAGLCAEAGKPMLLHTNEPVGHLYPGKSPMTLGGLAKLLSACPNTRFQLAHLGGGIFFYLWLKRGMKKLLENCVTDCSALPFLFRPAVLRYLAESGVRILFGSDWPLLTPARYRRDLEKAGLGPEQLQQIRFSNALEFWAQP
jgi:predicted TIM-barrel fold metal-dependent hydrolase